MIVLAAPVLAHYLGIDEVGVFVIPALAALAALRWAERRARSRSETEARTPDVDVDSPSSDH